MDLEQAKKILKAQKPALQKRYHVKSLGIFGSYVRGEQKKKSDLDVLVEFSKSPDLFKFVEIRDHLSEETGVKVDLVMKSALKEHIGKQILSEVVMI